MIEAIVPLAPHMGFEFSYMRHCMVLPPYTTHLKQPTYTLNRRICTTMGRLILLHTGHSLAADISPIFRQMKYVPTQ